MRTLPRSIVLVLCIAGLTGAARLATNEQSTSPTMLESYQRARAIVDAAVAAHGGAAALAAARTARFVFEGERFWRHQSRRADPPYDRAFERDELLLDLSRGRVISARWQTYPGGAHRHTGFITDGTKGFSVDFRHGTHTVASYPPAEEQTGQLYNLPQFVLADMAASGRLLRSLGRLRLTTGDEVDVVTTMMRGSLMTVGFDPRTHLLRVVLQVANDLVNGEGAAEAEFLDYRDRAGVMMPSRRIQRAGGVTIRDQSIEYEPGFAIPDARVLPPAGSVEVTSQTAEPVRTLAPGVWAIGGGSAALAVAFADHVVVVDAPGNASDILARLSTLAPGKPVRVVVPTHHHDDHSGGVARFVREGASVITTPGNRRFMERVAGDGAKVEVMTDPVRLFEDSTRRLEIHRMDGGPHAEEMLVVWIPALGVLYQADLIDIGTSGATPPGTNNETTMHFATWLRERHWPVKVYAGSHGFLPNPEAFAALVKSPIVPLR